MLQSTSSMGELPPEAVVMRMAMGGWVARAISEVSRLDIPDRLRQNGPKTAADLVTDGVNANPEALERVMRACASVGLFTESADGRFGPTELSNVLTSISPLSVKAIAEEMAGTWMKFWLALDEAMRTGEPQAEKVVGMGWWDYLNANPVKAEGSAKL